MPSLSNEQQALRASIKKGAIIWGLVLGVIVAALAYWMLGSQDGMIRKGAAALAGLVVAGGMYRKSMATGSAGAQCSKCNAAFSVSRVNRDEVLASSEARESRKELENGDTEITTWVEETYDVDDTYSCSKCSDVSHKKYQTTRKRDEKVVVKSAGKKGGVQSKGNTKQSGGKSSGKN